MSKQQQTASNVAWGIPPPPPVFVALSAFEPSPDECDDHVLTVSEGDKFGETRDFEKCTDWLRVTRLGHPRGHEMGWVPRAVLCPFEETRKSAKAPPPIDAEMSVNHSPTSFHPFLGSWDECSRMLRAIVGIWEDDRGRKSKTYKITGFLEGYANVLTELRWGEYRHGTRLVKIRKVVDDTYCIMWSEKFVLNRQACKAKLQWLPICEQTHSTWFWKRNV